MRDDKGLKKRVIVIIVTYNGIKWVDKCFGSVYESDLPVDVIAIDNGSNDGTVARILEKYPHIYLVETNENLGFGKANNIGMRYTMSQAYDYVFLLNQDAWVDSSTIGNLVDALDENHEFGILSPIHFNGNGSQFDKLFEKYVSEKHVPGFLDDYLAGRTLDEIYKVPFINAAAWMISKKAFLSVGLFHPLFFHYGEDNNYVDRLYFSGYKLGLLPNCKVYHDRSNGVKNDLKLAPQNRFRQQILKKLLHPSKQSDIINIWFGVRECYTQMKKISLLKWVSFIGWALKTYKEIKSDVDNFDDDLLKV